MRSLLMPAFLLLVACGGDDGDTIVQGSKDDQARSQIEEISGQIQTNSQTLIQAQSEISNNAEKIGSLESDISALSADISDNADAINILNQSSAIMIYDSTDLPIGRLLQLQNSDISSAGAAGIGVTTKGHLFQIDFFSSPRYWSSYDMYFESPDCTGTHLLLSTSISSPMRNLGAVFYDNYRPDKSLLYLPKKQAIRQNTPVNSYQKADEDICRGVAQVHDVFEVYFNDPEITGATTLGTAPHYIQ